MDTEKIDWLKVAKDICAPPTSADSMIPDARSIAAAFPFIAEGIRRIQNAIDGRDLYAARIMARALLARLEK